jgi:hypothetical protein
MSMRSRWSDGSGRAIAQVFRYRGSEGTSSVRADVDAVVTAVKAAGLKVISVDGVAQPIPPNFKGALIADLNNFFLTAFAPCDGCAPGLAAPERSTR